MTEQPNDLADAGSGLRVSVRQSLGRIACTIAGLLLLATVVTLFDAVQLFDLVAQLREPLLWLQIVMLPVALALPLRRYSVALLGTFGLGVRDVQWIPVGTDVSGRAAALQTNRADATLLTAPNYFRLEEAGFPVLANLADHPSVFLSTVYLFARKATTDNPTLAESVIKAHAEAIKRFYEDKPFAVKTYITFDRQPEADVARIYDLYAKGNIFERVPYVMAGAVKATLSQQVDPRLAADLKGFDFRKVVDNSVIDKLVKEGFFQQLFGPGVKAEEQSKAKLAFR